MCFRRLVSDLKVTKLSCGRSFSFRKMHKFYLLGLFPANFPKFSQIDVRCRHWLTVMQLARPHTYISKTGYLSVAKFRKLGGKVYLIESLAYSKI